MCVCVVGGCVQVCGGRVCACVWWEGVCVRGCACECVCVGGAVIVCVSVCVGGGVCSHSVCIGTLVIIQAQTCYSS